MIGRSLENPIQERKVLSLLSGLERLNVKLIKGLKNPVSKMKIETEAALYAIQIIGSKASIPTFSFIKVITGARSGWCQSPLRLLSGFNFLSCFLSFFLSERLEKWGRDANGETFSPQISIPFLLSNKIPKRKWERLIFFLFERPGRLALSPDPTFFSFDITEEEFGKQFFFHNSE